jgi:hypothetical protein
MARWLQSAGLQHLAAPLAGGGPATVGPGVGLDPRAGVLPSLLLQVPLSLQNFLKATLQDKDRFEDENFILFKRCPDFFSRRPALC